MNDLATQLALPKEAIENLLCCMWSLPGATDRHHPGEWSPKVTVWLVPSCPYAEMWSLCQEVALRIPSIQATEHSAHSEGDHWGTVFDNQRSHLDRTFTLGICKATSLSAPAVKDFQFGIGSLVATFKLTYDHVRRHVDDERLSRSVFSRT
ncbi:hypothetical protein, conserved [Leishmania tarentolae]|uniref:Flagellar attachment zone protein 1 conserved domain-containing protein n=1 Tax=Leishmania tarentolae TaxID=5689 RepID=A0A640KR39_LEITA|nr:hypothetical protein, conserved [Leishmania tarentolae]